MKKETKLYFKQLCKLLRSDINDIPEFMMKEWEKLKDEFEQYKKESIKWSIEDFENIATNNEEAEDGVIKTLYDRSKFQYALELMIKEHDCNNGILWDTIACYLDKYCKLK